MPKLHAFLFFRSRKIQTPFISYHKEIDLSSHKIEQYQHSFFHIPPFVDGSGAGRKLRVHQHVVSLHRFGIIGNYQHEMAAGNQSWGLCEQSQRKLLFTACKFMGFIIGVFWPDLLEGKVPLSLFPSLRTHFTVTLKLYWSAKGSQTKGKILL